MLKIIQSRSWESFHRCLARIPSAGWLVATPPDLTLGSLELHNIRSPVTNFCIRTNTLVPYDTYIIARDYSQLLLCGTYLMNLQTAQILPTELLEEEDSRSRTLHLH